MKAVADAGHEVGLHGYSHENPIEMTREQETDVLDKSIELVTKLCNGKRPTGYAAPWWEFSKVSNEILLERGIKYDHSLMHNDHTPYYIRVGDSWTNIDYTKDASVSLLKLVGLCFLFLLYFRIILKYFYTDMDETSGKRN
jgi:peptidoglycan/xylan/chitin deacetylase (PgdA/CDA1 family)